MCACRIAQFDGHHVAGVVIQAAGYQVGGSTPALGIVGIVGDGENQFLLCIGILAVVLHEELLIVGAQAIVHADDCLGGIAGFLPLGRASVDLVVQVEACQQSLCSTFRGAGVRHAAHGRHVAAIDQVQQFTFNPFAEGGTANLRGQCSAADVLFRGKRRVAEHVHHHIVGERSQEAGLGTESCYALDVASGTAHQKFVGAGDRHHAARVDGNRGGVSCGCPRSVLCVGDVAVTPGALQGIGGHFVEHHILAGEFTLAGIVHGNVGRTRIILADQRERTIDVSQTHFKVGQGIVGGFAGLICLVQGKGVQIPQTRTQCQGRGGDCQAVYQFFHNAFF